MTIDALERDLRAAYTRLLLRRARRRRTAVVAGVVSGVALAIAGGAIGAASLLGWPAPEHVRHEIAAVDRGLPTDLQLDPDVEHARAVASTANATLYAASLRDGGGSCTEIVTADGRGRGATCSAAAAAGAIELTAPSDEGAGPDEGVVIGGRVNPTATQLEVSYPDGSSDRVDLGADRYYLLEVPAQQRASVRAKGLELVSRDREGAVVGRAAVPADWDDAPVPDEQAPLFVSTRSNESDFTKVYGLEGHVAAAGAVKLQLDYGDGTLVSLPLAPDGSYDYTVPPDRIGDFMKPRTLLGLDAKGRVVASATVAAVAFWRGHSR